ncbi:MAG: hypothetical protein ACTSVY_10940 [Candidatus Helarchaeota archaeon]
MQSTLPAFFAILPVGLLFVIMASALVDLILLIYLIKRYIQRRTKILGYLLITSILFYSIITLVFGILFISFQNLSETPLLTLEQSEFFGLLIFRIVNILGMAIIPFMSAFVFNLFLEKSHEGILMTIFLISGFYMGLNYLIPYSFLSIEGNFLYDWRIPPTNIIMISQWVLQILIIISWVIIIYVKKKDVKDVLKSTGFSYIYTGTILSLIASTFSLILRLMPIDPGFTEVIQPLVYWIFIDISNVYLYLGLIMPDWLKNRVVGSTWIEVQGKKL